jgi:membrane-associated protease RseP (regulator of RpoE activity)
MVNNKIIDSYIDSLKDIIDIDVAYGGGRDVLLRGDFGPLGSVSEVEIMNRIGGLPGKAEIASVSPRVVIRVQMPGEIKKRKIPWLNIILFFLTVITTLLVGAAGAGVNFVSHPEIIWNQPSRIIFAGGPFSLSLLGILVFHEFGHYTASRIHGVAVTLPYFIPFPNIIGTLGAVIRLKSPFISRKQLLDVGAAGPLSGMVIALPVTIWGLSNPIYVSKALDPGSLINLGDSLLYTFIAWLVQPSPPDGYIAVMNPVAFAGWVGFLVTMLNLLPIGQLDGGHILYAMFGKVQHKIAYGVLLGLVALSFFWVGWIIWAILGFILIRAKHPPTVLDEIPLDKKRMAIGYLCIIVFILCFIPMPFPGL